MSLTWITANQKETKRNITLWTFWVDFHSRVEKKDSLWLKWFLKFIINAVIRSVKNEMRICWRSLGSYYSVMCQTKGKTTSEKKNIVSSYTKIVSMCCTAFGFFLSFTEIVHKRATLATTASTQLIQKEQFFFELSMFNPITRKCLWIVITSKRTNVRDCDGCSCGFCFPFFFSNWHNMRHIFALKLDTISQNRTHSGKKYVGDAH